MTVLEAIPGAPRRSYRGRRRCQPENAIQADIIGYLRAVLHSTESLIYANPNASRRTPGGKASNAVPGLTCGIPDLSIVIRGGRIFYFEVKTDDGDLSDAQKTIAEKLKAMGVPFAVVRSIDDVRAALASWNLKTREAA